MVNTLRDGLAAAIDNLLPNDMMAAEIGFPVSNQIHNKYFCTVTPERVLKSFNTRAFKRERPDNPDLMLQVIARAISRDAPLPFVLYWGKGPRSGLGAPEIKSLNFLASLAARVREVYAPGARITIVFTDTHATLNGHSAQSINDYYGDLAQAAREHDFETCRLDDLMKAHETPAVDDDINPAALSEVMLAALRTSAAKWFKGSGTTDQGAIQYYRANMREKKVVEHAFPDSIFVTFNGSGMRALFPDHLPIFYMYSLRHGICAKPWFLPLDFIYHEDGTRSPAIDVGHRN